MGRHTTDEVYEELTSVRQTVDTLTKNPKSVTLAQLDNRVADLKAKIEKGPKKDDEKKSVSDLVKDMALVKAALEILKGKDGWAKVLLIVAAISTTLGAIGLKIFDIQAAFKSATLAYTGRKNAVPFLRRTERSEEDRKERRKHWQMGDHGLPVLKAEKPEGQLTLPDTANIDAARRALHKLNGVLANYNSGVGRLPSSQALRKTARAAERLDRVASQHAHVTEFAGSLDTLREKFTQLSGVIGGAASSA